MILSPIRSPIRSPLYSPLAKGGGGTSDPDANAFFARMGTAPSPEYRAAYTELVIDAKRCGVWSTLFGLWVHGGENTTDSLLNLVGAYSTLVEPNGGVMQHEAGKGKTGDGTSYLGKPAIASANLSQSSIHIGLMMTKMGNGQNQFGTEAVSNNVLLSRTGTLVTFRCNDGSTRQTSSVAGVGVMGMRRTGTTVCYEESGSVKSTVTGSTAPALAVQFLHIMRHLTGRSTDRQLITWIGTYVDDTAMTLWHAAITKFAAAIGFVLPTAPAGLVEITRSPLTATTLPDGASGSDAGVGFTCTGAVQDAQDGTWWVTNYGQSAGHPTQTGSYVHLDANFGFLGEITGASLGIADGVDLQGVCEDTSNNTLYGVAPTANKLYNFSKAGSLLSSVGLTGANGVAYDPANDCLIISTASTIFRVNKATGLLVGLTYRIETVSGGDLDQIYYDPTAKLLYGSAGNNGSNGLVRVFDMNSPYGYPQEIKRIRLTGFLAAEGIARVGNTLYAFSDEAFHGSGPVNRVLTYDFTGI